MNIQQLEIKQFRCFSACTFSFESPYTLLIGNNGTGKTTVLEALYYLCYLRSFRTSSPRDLIQFEQDGFFVRALFANNHDVGMQELQAGFSSKKRLVKLNKKSIASYKDILTYYRVVSLTEDDVWLIKGGPEVRRTYIDHALFLADHTYADLLKKHRVILDNRNALLQHITVDASSYDVWTEQLFQSTQKISSIRIAWLKDIQKRINELLQKYVDTEISVLLEYRSKKDTIDSSYQLFKESHSDLYMQEIRFRRSLFGAHLDDIAIVFQGKKSRQFASRGQQKMVVLLMKVAQLQALKPLGGLRLFLLDDFMTDFDESRLRMLLSVLFDLDCQLVFTVPSSGTLIESILLEQGGSRVTLTMCKDAS